MWDERQGSAQKQQPLEWAGRTGRDGGSFRHGVHLGVDVQHPWTLKVHSSRQSETFLTFAVRPRIMSSISYRLEPHDAASKAPPGRLKVRY
jgi:hypothetical protein